MKNSWLIPCLLGLLIGGGTLTYGFDEPEFQVLDQYDSHHFELFDHNHDGYIAPHETRSKTEGDSPFHDPRRFELADQNNDGLLTRHEIRRHRRRILRKTLRLTVHEAIWLSRHPRARIWIIKHPRLFNAYLKHPHAAHPHLHQ